MPTTVTFPTWVSVGTMRHFRQAIAYNGGKIIAKTGHTVTLVAPAGVKVSKIAEFFSGVVV